MDTLGGAEDAAEEKLEKINKTIQGSNNKVNDVLHSLLADYLIDIYSKYFGSPPTPGGKPVQNISDRQARELRTSLNTLISAGYTSHDKKEGAVDLATLRNNVSRLIMQQQNQTKKLLKENKEPETRQDTAETKDK